MSRIVIKDRRFNRTTKKAYKLIASFKAKDIQPQTTIPEYILNHWKTNRGILGYATFRDLTKEEATIIFALAKGVKILLGINRFGDISGFKIMEVKNA